MTADSLRRAAAAAIIAEARRIVTPNGVERDARRLDCPLIHASVELRRKHLRHRGVTDGGERELTAKD
jgi:hypothetical protein